MAAKKSKIKKEFMMKWIFTLTFFLLTMICLVLGILSFHNMPYGFVQKYFIWLAIGYTLLLTAVCLLAIWCTHTEKERATKTIFSGYLLSAVLLFFFYILQKTGFFEVVQTPEKLQIYLESMGGWMPVSYIVLQFLQVVILPIPSVVSTVAGVALFGAFRATIYSFIGILIGSIVAFFIGRKLGYRAVGWIIGKETLDKWRKKLKGKDNLFLTTMFIFPMFPDDVLCFMAGLSSMSTKYFLSMITVSRIISVSTTCYSFNFIPFTTWWGLLIWGVLFAILILLFLYVYKHMDEIQAKLAKRFSVFRRKNK